MIELPFDTRARLEAVMSIQPPLPTDGEIRCLTPGCRAGARLSRKDRACWWCGGDDFEIVSGELKVWMRIPEPVAVQPTMSENPLTEQAILAAMMGLPLPSGYALAPVPAGKLVLMPPLAAPSRFRRLVEKIGLRGGPRP